MASVQAAGTMRWSCHSPRCLVYLVPSLDLVAVFTGGAFNQESPVNTMMAKVLPALLEPSSRHGK